MEIEDIISKIKPTNKNMLNEAKKRTSQLIMPYRALGRIHDISEKLCSIYSTLKPNIHNKCVFVMAADHGVAEEGVSAYPQEVTAEMLKAFLNGYATINVLAESLNCDVIVTDVGIKSDIKSDIKNFTKNKIRYGTDNFTKGPAMSREEAIKSIKVGFDITNKFIKKKALDIVITGDMGIGNTTASSAIGSIVCSASVDSMTGYGTGINDAKLKKKIEIIKKAIEINKPNKDDPIDILYKVGGLEIGAITGSILACAYNSMPVVIDGLISTAAALVAYKLTNNVLDYIFASHQSKERGHKIMLDFLGLDPILNLNMGLGEGTGGVLTLCVINAAANVISNVATFDEAHVSKST